MFTNKNKNKGFTLISVLISVTILFVITPMLSKVLFQVSTLDERSLNENISVSTFFHFLQLELYEGNGINVTPSRLYITREYDETVTIEQYNDSIRRRVNLTGHEILLFHVKSVNFIEEENGLTTQVETMGGNKFARKLYIPIKKNPKQ